MIVNKIIKSITTWGLCKKIQGYLYFYSIVLKTCLCIYIRGTNSSSLPLPCQCLGQGHWLESKTRQLACIALRLYIYKWGICKNALLTSDFSFGDADKNDGGKKGTHLGLDRLYYLLVVKIYREIGQKQRERQKVADRREK